MFLKAVPSNHSILRFTVAYSLNFTADQAPTWPPPPTEMAGPDLTTLKKEKKNVYFLQITVYKLQTVPSD